MCGKACQIPATMARDLPQLHTVYVWVCVWVGEQERWSMPVGCKHDCYEKTERAEKKHKMAKHRVYQQWKILPSCCQRQAGDGPWSPTVEEVNWKIKHTNGSTISRKEHMLYFSCPLFSSQHLSALVKVRHLLTSNTTGQSFHDPVKTRGRETWNSETWTGCKITEHNSYSLHLCPSCPRNS